MSLVVGFSANAMHILCTQTIKLFEFVCLLFAVFSHRKASTQLNSFSLLLLLLMLFGSIVQSDAISKDTWKIEGFCFSSLLENWFSVLNKTIIKRTTRERERKKKNQQTVGWMLWVLTGTMRHFRQTFGFYFAFGFPPFFVNLIVIQAFIGRSLNKRTKFALFCALSWPSTLLNVNSRTIR